MDDEEEEKMMDRSAVIGSFCGTLNFITPEVFTNQEQTLAIDIWALGNILFKLITGKVPFGGKEQMSV
jgi:serine/threonine protein kinase